MDLGKKQYMLGGGSDPLWEWRIPFEGSGSCAVEKW